MTTTLDARTRDALAAAVAAAVTEAVTLALTPDAPAAPKAPKTAKKAEKPAAKLRYLTKANRRDFVAECEWDVAGWPTHEIRAAVEAGYIELPEGWALPQGHVRKAVRG